MQDSLLDLEKPSKQSSANGLLPRRARATARGLDKTQKSWTQGSSSGFTMGLKNTT